MNNLYYTTILMLIFTIKVSAQCNNVQTEAAFLSCLPGPLTVSGSITVNNADLSGADINVKAGTTLSFTGTTTIDISTVFSGTGSATVAASTGTVSANGSAGSTASFTDLNNAIQSGLTTLEDAMASANGILPIDLISFSISNRDKNAILYWSTASENNNDYFEIQSSSDNQYFKPIGAVKGAKNSTTERKYQFLVREINQGVNYFRIKQVDLNGDYSYTPIISFSNSNQDGILIQYLTNERTLSIDNAENGRVQIFNLNGKMLSAFEVTSDYQEYDLSSLNTGIYIAFFISNNVATTFKFSKV